MQYAACGTSNGTWNHYECIAETNGGCTDDQIQVEENV